MTFIFIGTNPPLPLGDREAPRRGGLGAALSGVIAKRVRSHGYFTIPLVAAILKKEDGDHLQRVKKILEE